MNLYPNIKELQLDLEKWAIELWHFEPRRQMLSCDGWSLWKLMKRNASPPQFIHPPQINQNLYNITYLSTHILLIHIVYYKSSYTHLYVHFSLLSSLLESLVFKDYIYTNTQLTSPHLLCGNCDTDNDSLSMNKHTTTII